MTAAIIARDLNLNLYQIDLSNVISKYIGETENNLNKIFKKLETNNVISFLDEADALIGQHSAVEDAVDRYANIETVYLLRKMEKYEGIFILAKKFKTIGGNIKNIIINKHLHPSDYCWEFCLLPYGLAQTWHKSTWCNMRNCTDIVCSVTKESP